MEALDIILQDTLREYNRNVAARFKSLKGLIPSLKGYATEQWVREQKYLTGLDLKGLGDVLLTDLKEGQVLSYSNGKWINTDAKGGIDDETLERLVTTDTQQTITGHKTFRSLVTIGSQGKGAPNDEVNINLIALNPIAHSGGPWYINSLDNPTAAFLRILYKDNELFRFSTEGTFTAKSIVKSGGTASQFLKADGSVDSKTYLPLSGGTMSNSNIVGNLNADLLDGKHEYNFVKALYGDDCDGNKDMNDMWNNQSFIGSVTTTENAPNGNGWYNVVQVAHRNGTADGPSYVGQIALGMTVNHDRLYYRTHRTRGWQTAARLTDNVASATKLQTARTIWGQSFDGSGDVTGILSGVGGINYSGNGESVDQYGNFRFGSNSSAWNIYNNEGTSLLCVRRSTGNVCIGVADSIHKLDVNGSSLIRGTLNILCTSAQANFNQGIRLYGSAKDSTYSLIMFGCDSSTNIGTHNNQWTVGRTNTNSFVIDKGNATGANGLVITSDLNVGIGTSSPKFKFDANGSGRIGEVIMSDQKISFCNAISCEGYTDTWSDGTHNHTWYGLDFLTDGNWANGCFLSYYTGILLKTAQGSFKFSEDGKFKLGDSNAGISYDQSSGGLIFYSNAGGQPILSGNGAIFGTTSSRWTIYASSLNYTSLVNGSDIRLKSDITPINNLSVQQIAGAPLVKFKWRDNGMKGIGTIAQYWLNVYPDFVETDNRGYLQLHSMDICLSASIILAREIELLKKEIEKMKKQ